MARSDFTHRLDEAIHLAEAGQKKQAEIRLRELVAEGARLPKATMALGVLCGERGDLPQRRLWLQEACRLEAAISAPPLLRLRLNLLVDALEQGDLEMAIAYGEEALDLAPEDGEAKFHLARVYLASGMEQWRPLLDQASNQLKLKLNKYPEDVRTWRLLATAHNYAERIDDAISAYTSALALDPNELPSLIAISRLLIGRGQCDVAIPWLMNALALAPDDPVVLTLNGVALNALSGAGEAIPILRQALKADPFCKEASITLGECLYNIGLFAEASRIFEKALELHPGDVELRSGMAAALRNMGEIGESLKLYQNLFEEAPGNQAVFTNLMFTYSISETIKPENALETARCFWKRKEVCSGTGNLPRNFLVRTDSALKVGLLSADIGTHVVGRFLDPLLRYHDRNRCQLELISMRRRYESRSEVLISLADNFLGLEGLSTDQSREILKQQDYDLIVDTSGYTLGSGIHLLADRCAPVQAHYIGYHATTGLSTIDWFIGDDETVAPELQHQFSERLWRLPRPWLAYPKELLFPEAKSYMETDRLILGSFCQTCKITEATLKVWGEILRRFPSALLVLKGNGLQDKGVGELIKKSFEKHEVSSDRIRLIPPVGEWSEHLEFYNILDIALDTTPWSSATTGFEALGMGVPLVALRGDRMAARMSSSLVKGLGHREWIAHSAMDAVNIIEHLSESLPKLRENKKRLQEKALASVLWDGVSLCKKLEQAFEKMCLGS